jgi:basic membrane protein A
VPTAAVHPTTTLVATAVSVQPTTAPVTTVADQSAKASIKVGLVTNTAGVSDQAFNQLAWQGIQKASTEMGFSVKFLESKQVNDYEKNITALANDGYNVIITVGSAMGDATAVKAKQYPTIQFAIIDHAYEPTNGSQACAETVQDCYADGGLSNVTSLMFAEEQAGFLAGVLAGGMSNLGFICSISSLRTPRSDRSVISFRAGAVWQAGENIKGMNNYINIQTTDPNVPNVADSTEGKTTAQNLINNGCDVVFGIAANGALVAAKENNLMAVGNDVDQYNTVPEAKEALLTSTEKKVDVAVYNYLKTVADGSVRAGISTGTLQNGGVGLAPFHDWDGRIPADLKAQIQKASDDIKDGLITVEIPH